MIINLNRSFLSVSHARLSNLKTNTQQGVVLFFALIALVVMSLAAVALIRSVDTNSLIAGNLSFKQSSMLSADTGVETAITWVTNNAGLLEANSEANGYYATSDVPAHPDAKALVDNYGVAGIIVNPDSQGNKITYCLSLIHISTSHYVTEVLDEGPIIEQDIDRISHRDQVEDLIQKGRDLERVVLSKAVRWHIENRILLYANKTVIFD